MIDLQAFCSTDSYRSNILRPWSKGAYSYATNDHIAIRVDRREDVPENEAAPDVEVALRRAQAGVGDTPAVHVPVLDEPAQKMCDLCEGSGKSHKCPDDECDGGTVIFNTGRHEYEFECKQCDGHGFIAGGEADCPDCAGTGLGGHETIPISVEEQYFDQFYLALATKHLPKCWITTNKSNRLEAALLKFDGGIGALMPMNINNWKEMNK